MDGVEQIIQTIQTKPRRGEGGGDSGKQREHKKGGGVGEGGGKPREEGNRMKVNLGEKKPAREAD